MVHGLGTDGSAWDSLVPRLARAFRVIVVQVPGYSIQAGFGAPFMPPWRLAFELDVFLRSIAVERYALVCHSRGGAVGIWCSVQSPERVSALVLINPWGVGRTDRSDRRLRDLSSVLLRPLDAMSLSAEVLKSWKPTSVEVKERLKPSSRRVNLSLIRPESAAIALRGWLGAFVETRRSSSSERAQVPIGTPTLVIWGLRDPFLGSHNAREAAGQSTASSIAVVPRGGHSPHRSQPAEVADRIIDFLSKRPIDQ